MERFIGLDVHAASCTAVVIDARGKRVGSPHVLEANGQAPVEFFTKRPGTVHVCMEEGTLETITALRGSATAPNALRAPRHSHEHAR